MKISPDMPLCMCCSETESMAQYAHPCNGCGILLRYNHGVVGFTRSGGNKRLDP
jgi:hypothetical protein